MTRHLAAPLRLSGSGSLVTLAQDGPQEVAQSVALLVATRPGERRSEPGYGTRDGLFVTGSPASPYPDTQALLAAVSQWEPRADPAALDVALRSPGQEDAVVRITLTPGAGVDVI